MGDVLCALALLLPFIAAGIIGGFLEVGFFLTLLMGAAGDLVLLFLFSGLPAIFESSKSSNKSKAERFYQKCKEKGHLCKIFCINALLWCGRQELNLHGVTHKILSLARLPVPPRPH